MQLKTYQRDSLLVFLHLFLFVEGFPVVPVYLQAAVDVFHFRFTTSFKVIVVVLEYQFPSVVTLEPKQAPLVDVLTYYFLLVFNQSSNYCESWFLFFHYYD